MNTNKLVRFYEGADGLKTGHTDAAGYCIAVTAKKNNLRLIGIVLGEENSQVRNVQAMNLMDYGFNNMRTNILKKKGEIVKEIKLDKANQEKIKIILEENLVVAENIDDSRHSYKYEIKIDNLKLPIKKGNVVGKILVLDNGKEVTSKNLIIEKNVRPLSYYDLFISGFKDLILGEM